MIEGTTIASTGDAQDSITALTPAEPATAITDREISAASRFDPLAAEIEAAKQLWIEIELEVRRGKLEPGEELTADDEQTIRDSFDGATGLDTIIRNTLLQVIDLETIAPGIDVVISNLQARKVRAKKAIEWRRALIERAMIMARWIGKEKTLRLDVGTVNVRPATPTVEVLPDSEALIPLKYWKKGDPVLDKATLKTDVLGRYKAMEKALAIADQTDRETALAKVVTDFGPEVPGASVKIDGHTLTLKFS